MKPSRKLYGYIGVVSRERRNYYSALDMKSIIAIALNSHIIRYTKKLCTVCSFIHLPYLLGLFPYHKIKMCKNGTVTVYVRSVQCPHIFLESKVCGFRLATLQMGFRKKALA